MQNGCMLKACSHNSIPPLSYLESDGILTDMQADVLSLGWLYKSFTVELGKSIFQTVTLFHQTAWQPGKLFSSTIITSLKITSL